jgi:hypothetical protein
MFNRPFVVVACAVAVTALLTASSTQGWSRLNANHLTFNRAVALPGVVLVAGDYTFESGPEDSSDLTIVRVMTRDGTRVLFTGFTTRLTRPASAKGLLVSVGEAPAGAPIPITAWYLVGSERGYGFQYQ